MERQYNSQAEVNNQAPDLGLLQAADGKSSRVLAQVDRDLASVSDDDEIARLEAAIGLDQNESKQAAQRQEKEAEVQSAMPEEGFKAAQDKFSKSAEKNRTGASRVGDAVSELPGAVAGGVLDFSQNVVNGIITAGDWLEDAAAKIGIGKGDLINKTDRVDWSKAIAQPNLEETRALRAITKFVAPLAIPGGQGTASKMAVGAAVDFLGFDPNQERLSNLVQEVPALRNPVTAYLAHDPSDSEAEGRFKNMLEGLGIMGAANAALRGGLGVIKGIRTTKLAQQVPKAAEVVEQEAKQLGIFEKQWAEAYPRDGKTFHADPIIGEPKSVEELSDSIGINLSKLNSSDEVLQFVTNFAKKNKDQLAAEGRGVMNNEQVMKAAQDLLGDANAVGKLINRQTGKPWNAEELVAAKAMVTAAGEDFAKKAEAVVKNAEDVPAKLAFEDAKQAFGLIYGSFRGGTTETARALSAGRIVLDGKITGIARAKMAEEALRMAGGADNVADTAAKIKAIYDIPDGNFGEAMGEIQKLSKFHRFEEALSFYVVNNLLSGKSTASAFIGNALNAATNVVDMTIAAGIGKFRNTPDAISFTEVGHEINGQMQSLLEAMQAAGKSLKTAAGEGPAKALKGDFPTINPISGERAGITDASNAGARAVGKLMDGTGLALSVPSRLIATADSFWGTVFYRGKIRSSAYAEAVQKGLEGEARSQFITNFITKPPEEAHLAAVAFAKEQVFAKPLEGVAAGIDDGLRNKVPLGRVIFPFFRTTANEIEYIAKHSPLALVSPRIRADITKGGREGQLAMAKIATGMTATGTMAYLAATGIVTGEVPRNRETERALRESNKGWQENSVKIGDTYISMDKFGPLAGAMRVGAMLSDMRNYLDDGEFQELAVAAGSAVADAFTPEMFVDNVSDFMKVFSVMANPSASSQDKKEAESTMLQMTTRLQPLGGMQEGVAKMVDPVKPYAQAYKGATGPLADFMNQVGVLYKSRTPYLSKDVPAQRNIFGDVILAPAGLGPDIVSPFATSTGDNSELVDRLQTMAGWSDQLKPINPDIVTMDLSMPPRTITNINDGEGFELTPKEYEEYIIASAGRDPHNGKSIGAMNLRDALSKVVMGPGYDRVLDKGPLAVSQFNAAVKEIVSSYREIGLGYLLKNSDIKTRMRREFEARNKLKEIKNGGQ